MHVELINLSNLDEKMGFQEGDILKVTHIDRKGDYWVENDGVVWWFLETQIKKLGEEGD